MKKQHNTWKMFAHDKLCVAHTCLHSIPNTMKRMQRSKRFSSMKQESCAFLFVCVCARVQKKINSFLAGLNAQVCEFFSASKSCERSATVNARGCIRTTLSMHEILARFFLFVLSIYFILFADCYLCAHNVHLCVYYFQRCDSAECISLFVQQRIHLLFFSSIKLGMHRIHLYQFCIWLSLLPNNYIVLYSSTRQVCPK